MSFAYLYLHPPPPPSTHPHTPTFCHLLQTPRAFRLEVYTHSNDNNDTTTTTTADDDDGDGDGDGNGDDDDDDDDINSIIVLSKLLALFRFPLLLFVPNTYSLSSSLLLSRLFVCCLLFRFFQYLSFVYLETSL